MDPRYSGFARLIYTSINSPRLFDQNGNRIESDQEPEPKFDPLETIREQTRLRQRDIILKLQARLADMIEAGDDIEDIHTCTHAIGLNLEINEDILDVF